jgi:hypothetical protein
MTVHASPQPDLLEEPPPPQPLVLTVGAAGVGLVIAALVVGLVTGAPVRGYEAHGADGPRALLAALGLLVSGCAVSMRPKWFAPWLFLGFAGWIGYGFGGPIPKGTEWYVAPPRDWYAGVPDSWDSVQLFFGVAGAVAFCGAAWTFLPRKAVFALVLAGVGFHFAGILSAVLSPPPQPFLVDQYWRRVARPYLLFTYMNNAYQFYSPDPGPATELWVCVEYKQPGTADDDPDAPKKCVWSKYPLRSRDYKDPLGLEYYRRLSVTENVAQYPPRGYRLPPAEEELVQRRRNTGEAAKIPRHGFPEVQRMIPSDLVVRHVLPSYARHVAHDHELPGWDIKGIKVYRATHTIITLDQFVGMDLAANKRATPRSPYNPMFYMCYFQGEFDTAGNLKDPTDPLLYWLVPIIETAPLPASREEYKANGGYPHYFRDYVNQHAGCARPAE